MESSSLERELICPICTDYFTTPLSLPCQHNVCHKCAKDQLLSTSSGRNAHVHDSLESLNHPTSPTNSVASLPVTPSASSLRASFRRRGTIAGTSTNAEARAPPSKNPPSKTPPAAGGRQKRESSSRSGGSTAPLGGRRESLPMGSPVLARSKSMLTLAHASTFFCPTCQDSVVLGERGLNGLYRNFALEVIVDRFKLAAKKAASIPCALCKVKPPLDATKSCLDCKLSYCNGCYKHHHPWGTPRAQHEHIGPTTNFRPKTITCTEHPTEKVTMYCDGCQKPVCHRCKFNGAHAKHKMSVIERKYTIVKEKLECHLAAIRGKRAAIQKGVDALTGLCEKVEENGALARESLTDALTALQSALADRNSAVTRATDEEITRRTEAVRAQLATYKEILKGCSVVDLAQEMLKETDKACFVQAARPILGRLIETVKVIKEAELSPVHAYHDFNNFSLDDRVAFDAVKHLSFYKAPDAPTISASRCQSYNYVTIEWDPPLAAIGKAPAETYVLEYRKLTRSESSGGRPSAACMSPRGEQTMATGNGRSDASPGDDAWVTVEGIKECRWRLTDLDPECRYKVKVRGENRAGRGDSSKCVVIRTVPAPVFSFKWTSSQPNGIQGLSISKDGGRISQRPNNNLFTPSCGPMPSSPVALSPSFCLGDRKITSGKHYWEVTIDQSPCAVQIGIISERRSRSLGDPVFNPTADRDSGHDSCEELDADYRNGADPTVLINYFGGKVYIPSDQQQQQTPGKQHGCKKTSSNNQNSNKFTAHSLASCAVGVCVEVDRGRVSFYDGNTLDSFFSVNVKLEGAVYPAVVIVGPGVVKSRQIQQDQQSVS